MHIIRRILLITVRIVGFVACIVVIFYLIFATFNYADPVNGCNITVSDKTLGGNKETILKALKFIRYKDTQNYKKVCMAINKIYERECYDQNSSTHMVSNLNQDGCVIKGTKTIFIYPQRDDTQEIIERRADEIVKLSKLMSN